jgi:hypothetical protein
MGTKIFYPMHLKQADLDALPILSYQGTLKYDVLGCLLFNIRIQSTSPTPHNQMGKQPFNRRQPYLYIHVAVKNTIDGR